MLSKIFYWVGWGIIKILTKIKLRMDVVSYAPLPLGPKILVANHPTTSDPFILLTAISERMSIIVREDLFTTKIFGRYLHKSGHIPANQHAFNAALQALKNGRSVLVFIEGDLSPTDGGYCRPKTGAVRLACESGAPIVPIGLGVQRENIQESYKKVKGGKILARWYFRGRYAVTVGKSFRLVADTANRVRVRVLSRHLLKRTIRLAEESRDRIGNLKIEKLDLTNFFRRFDYATVKS